MLISEVEHSYLSATPENINKAKMFLLQKWKERAAERGLQEPFDLSSACKFASLFGQYVFGGKIRGNWHHQYNVLPDGRLLDLTEPSEDLKRIINSGNDPYTHDRIFWNNSDHKSSMKSCIPRVKKWTKDFIDQIRRD